MALAESDLDRISDKMELAVTRAMEKHVKEYHQPGNGFWAAMIEHGKVAAVASGVVGIVEGLKKLFGH